MWSVPNMASDTRGAIITRVPISPYPNIFVASSEPKVDFLDSIPTAATVLYLPRDVCSLRHTRSGRTMFRRRASRYKPQILEKRLAPGTDDVTGNFTVQVQEPFVVRRGISNDWVALPLPRIVWVNTAVLLGSSLLLELARRSLKKKRKSVS